MEERFSFSFVKLYIFILVYVSLYITSAVGDFMYIISKILSMQSLEN